MRYFFSLRSCRMISVILSVGMLFCIYDPCTVAANTASSSLLDYTYTERASGNVYVPSLKLDYADNIVVGENDEIVYPEKYNDGTHGDWPVSGIAKPTADDNKIKSIVFNKTYRPGAGDLIKFLALEKVEFTYNESEAYSIPSIAYMRGASAPIPLKQIIIQAPYVSVGSNTFRNIQEGYKVLVKSQDVADTIINATKDGSYPVSADQIEIMQSSKEDSSFTITCDNISYKTKGGLKPTPNITKGDGTISYKLYTDEECKNEYQGSLYYEDTLPVGVYYIKGFMAETDNYNGSESPAVRVEVTALAEINKDALNQAIKDACAFFEIDDPSSLKQDNPNKDSYDAIKWSDAGYALSDADYIAKDTKDSYTQEEVDAAVKKLNDAIKELQATYKKPEAEWKTLQDTITKAEGLAGQQDKYTDASMKSLKNAIASAKELVQDTAKLSQIKKQTELLEAAINGLQMKPDDSLEPFAFVKKGGKEVKIATIQADAKMAGAKKILLTIKCADDVSFNDNASIELTATVGGKKNSKKIMGTGDYTNGASYVVTLPLSDEVKAGDSIDISAFTYAWDNAKDYVYGITKVELASESDSILYAYTDKEAARGDLTAKIAEADKLDLSAYTADSAAKVKGALKAAKELKADAPAADVKKALEALDAAIKALKKNPATPTPTPSSGPITGGETTVIGVAQGKTFTAGNFTYKVTKAATITGTKKTAGVVSVKALTKAGKKKSSINVKNTVSTAGASYNVTVIEKKAFRKAVKLKKATLGTNIKTVPASAFDGCKKLAAVSAKGAVKIDKGAFKGCKALKKLTLGKKKLSSVKKGAFKGCKKTIKVSGGAKKIRKANIKKLKKSGYKKFK